MKHPCTMHNCYASEYMFMAHSNMKFIPGLKPKSDIDQGFRQKKKKITKDFEKKYVIVNIIVNKRYIQIFNYRTLHF